MKSRVTRAIRQLLLPYGVLVFVGWIVPHVGFRYTARSAALLAFAICAMGACLALRFRVPRPLLAFLLLASVVSPVISAKSASAGAASELVALAAFLFPLNLALLLLIEETRFGLREFGLWAALLLVQSALVLFFYRWDEWSLVDWISHPLVPAGAPSLAIPQIPALAFGLAGVFLLARTLASRSAVDSGLFWSLGATFLAFISHNQRSCATFFTVASLVLGIAVVEASYRVAYHDELTGLPARRSFNSTIASLTEGYTIAMADIDHFKHFNDTYGHDVGDQVLRMVASRLADVTGGGQAFRCGGEEFAIVFADQGADEAFAHVEKLRLAIAQTPFVIRGPDRSHRPRRERRGGKGRRRLRTATLSTSVTMSFGIAEPRGKLSKAEQVILAADKALYRAKAAGRNRVEIYRPQTSVRSQAPRAQSSRASRQSGCAG